MVFKRGKLKNIDEEIQELEEEVEALEKEIEARKRREEKPKKIKMVEKIPVGETEIKSEVRAKEEPKEKIEKEKPITPPEVAPKELMPVSEEIFKREGLPSPEEVTEKVIEQRSLVEVEGPVFVSVRRYREIVMGLKEIEKATLNVKEVVGKMRKTKAEGIAELEQCVENLRTIEDKIESIIRVLKI